jgi:hypothetical protein
MVIGHSKTVHVEHTTVIHRVRICCSYCRYTYHIAQAYSLGLLVNNASLICPRIRRGGAIDTPAHITCWNPNMEGVVELPGTEVKVNVGLRRERLDTRLSGYDEPSDSCPISQKAIVTWRQ